MSARIYAALLEQCDRLQLGDGWGFLPEDPHSRLMAGDSAALVEALREQFDAAELQEARILSQTGDVTNLNPQLAAEDRVLIALRDAEGQTFDILTAQGTLRAAAPVLAVLNDSRTQDALRDSQRQLFVTATVRDTHLLRSLGLPATTAWRMDQLPGTCLERLAVVTDRYADDDRFVHLVLVGCGLMAGDYLLPPAIARAARSLAQTKRFMKKPNLAASVWWPPAEEIEYFEMLRRGRSSKLLRAFLAEHATRRSVDAFSDVARPPDRVPGYADSLECLLAAEARCREHPSGERERSRARAARGAYNKAVERFVSRPLLARAEETPDLDRRAIGLQLAHASRVLLGMLPDIHEAQARSLEGGGRPSLDFLSDVGWKRYQMAMDMVTGLVRESARTRNNDGPL